MKKTDLIGIGYIVGVVILIFVIFKEQFIWATIRYPIPMGFIKVAGLATFGECLKTRLKTGSWIPAHLIQRFVVWGLFGIWFTWAFAMYSVGVDSGLVGKGLWFSFWPFFSKSLWINLGGGYAYFMMLTHEYINKVIEKQGLLGPEEFAEKLDKTVWFPTLRWRWGCIPYTILWFWLPAHTFTFWLPGHFRILSAAFLAVALGFILTIKKK